MTTKFTHAALGTLGAGALLFAGMSSASAALPYASSESYDTVSCNSIGATEYCHAATGTRSGHANPAGRGLNKDEYEAVHTTTVDGELVREQEFTKKEITAWDIPWPHVSHVVEKGTVTTPDGHCRYHSVSHSSNSEVRVNHHRSTCDS